MATFVLKTQLQHCIKIRIMIHHIIININHILRERTGRQVRSKAVKEKLACWSPDGQRFYLVFTTWYQPYERFSSGQPMTNSLIMDVFSWKICSTWEFQKWKKKKNLKTIFNIAVSASVLSHHPLGVTATNLLKSSGHWPHSCDIWVSIRRGSDCIHLWLRCLCGGIV